MLSAIALTLATGWSIADGAVVRSAAPGTPEPTTSESENLPAGVRVERIAHTPEFQVNSGRRISLTVTRLRLPPGARFDWEFAGPILFIVETGELALEAARATIIERAPNEDAVRAPGGMKPIAGGRHAASAGLDFHRRWAIGSIRNDANEDLSLLVVSVIDEPTAADITVVPVLSTPQP